MNGLLLTKSFVDNCELKEINYRTKNLFVSWTLVEMRSLFTLHAFVCCSRKKHRQLRDRRHVPHRNPHLSEHRGSGLKDSVCLREMRREKCDSRECGPRAITWAQPRGALPSSCLLLPRFVQVPQDEAWDRGHGRRERAVSLRSPCAGDSRGSPTLWPWDRVSRVRRQSGSSLRLFTGCRTSTQGTGTSRKAGVHRSPASLPALRLEVIRIPRDRLYHGPSDGVQRAQQHCGRQTGGRRVSQEVLWGTGTEAPCAPGNSEASTCWQEYCSHEHIWK